MEHPVYCGWCRTHMHGPRVSITQPVSHGICARCARALERGESPMIMDYRTKGRLLVGLLYVLLVLTMLLAFLSSAHAQEIAPDVLAPELVQPAPAPEPVGMSRWAFWLAEGGELAAVATQEIAFAHFHVYDQAVGKRVASGAASLLLPVAVRWLLRKAPRADANVEAVIVGAWGSFGAAQNLKILITLHPGSR